jgi:hypothetical protein
VKIKNLTTKTSLEIEDSDVLVIEDMEDTKQITIKEFKEYLMNNGITKSTKVLINQMMDNVINSLQSSKYIITDLLTYQMNTTISDINGDIYITLKSVATDKWLTAEEIVNLLLPNEEQMLTKTFVISVLVEDTYVKCSSYSIHDASEIDEIVPEGNIGYIKAYFEGLTQNEVANIKYDDIVITTEDTEVTIVLPIEEMHEYEFIGDPDLFNNNVPYVQNIG